MTKRMTKAEIRAERDEILAMVKAKIAARKPCDIPEILEMNAAHLAYIEAEYAAMLATTMKLRDALLVLVKARLRFDRANDSLAIKIEELDRHNDALSLRVSKLKGETPLSIERMRAEHQRKQTRH